MLCTTPGGGLGQGQLFARLDVREQLLCVEPIQSEALQYLLNHGGMHMTSFPKGELQSSVLGLVLAHGQHARHPHTYPYCTVYTTEYLECCTPVRSAIGGPRPPWSCGRGCEAAAARSLGGVVSCAGPEGAGVV